MFNIVSAVFQLFITVVQNNKVLRETLISQYNVVKGHEGKCDTPSREAGRSGDKRHCMIYLATTCV